MNSGEYLHSIYCLPNTPSLWSTGDKNPETWENFNQANHEQNHLQKDQTAMTESLHFMLSNKGWHVFKHKRF